MICVLLCVFSASFLPSFALSLRTVCVWGFHDNSCSRLVERTRDKYTRFNESTHLHEMNFCLYKINNKMIFISVTNETVFHSKPCGPIKNPNGFTSTRSHTQTLLSVNGEWRWRWSCRHAIGVPSFSCYGQLSVVGCVVSCVRCVATDSEATS